MEQTLSDAEVLTEALRIARVCHEANRALQYAFGEEVGPPFDSTPQWQFDSTVKGVLACAAGDTPTPRDQHEAWMRDKIADGWIYGPTKDADRKTHPCLVPYDDLSPGQRAKDHVFQAIVRAMLRNGESA